MTHTCGRRNQHHSKINATAEDKELLLLLLLLLRSKRAGGAGRRMQPKQPRARERSRHPVPLCARRGLGLLWDGHRKRCRTARSHVAG